MSSKWPMVPLGELLNQYTDYINTPEAKTYPKLSVKLYGKGVTMDTPTNGTDLKMKRHQLAKDGQVILSEIWGKKGAIGFVPKVGDGALCTSHFFLFDVNKSKLFPKWLEYIFRANYLQGQLDLEAKGTTGYAAVRPAHLLKATIPLPDLTEQRRLVERIDTLAAKVDEAKNLRNLLTVESAVLLKASMRSVFTNLPEETVLLHTVCTAVIDCLHSNPIYAEDGIPTVRSPDVGWGQLLLSTALKTNEAEYQRRTSRGEPVPGDLIVVREGGGTGKAGMVEEGQRFSLGQRVMMLRPDREKVEPKFLLYQWLSPLIFEDQILGLMKGSASPHLNIGTAKEFKIRLPTLGQQRKAVAFLDQFRDRTEKLEQQQSTAAKELDAMFSAILDWAFRGEL